MSESPQGICMSSYPSVSAHKGTENPKIIHNSHIGKSLPPNNECSSGPLEGPEHRQRCLQLEKPVGTSLKRPLALRPG